MKSGDLAAFSLKKIGTLLVLVAIGNGRMTWADQTLSELQIFKRCYIRLTRQIPDPTHPLYKAVESGKQASDVACLALLDEAQLGSEGYLTQRSNPEARRILKTFHDLHRSWFQAKVNTQFKAMSYLVRDGEEDALYFTQAAFKKNIDFSSVVTLKQDLQGRRDRILNGAQGGAFQAQNLVSYNPSLPYGTQVEALVSYLDSTSKKVTAIRRDEAHMVQVGELVGVAPADSLRLPHFQGLQTSPSRVVGEADPQKATLEINAAVNANLNQIEVNQHFGAGILGSQTFLLNNANLALGEVPQGSATAAHREEAGEILIHRRISNRFFEDVLCHQFPNLTRADVASEVHLDSSLTFRHDVSCQQCHAQNDGAAKGLRHLYTAMSATGVDGSSKVGLPLVFIENFPTTGSLNAFALQAPSGRLFYRQMLTKELVDEPFTSLDQMGQIVASHDDLYRCAAKRYYAFLTGVNVSLSVKATSAIDKLHQDQVLKLATQLKADQSVRNLILRIFRSPSFRSSNYLSRGLATTAVDTKQGAK